MYHHEGLQDSQSPKALKVSLLRDLKGITTTCSIEPAGSCWGFGFCNAATETRYDRHHHPNPARQPSARPQRPRTYAR